MANGDCSRAGVGVHSADGGGGASDGREFDGREFRRVLGHYPTGVTVVTAACPDGPVGVTIGSFTSVSMEPPLVLFCLGRGSASSERLRSSADFCVNVLACDQVDLCLLFASRSEDRFRGVATRMEVTGAPVIEGCAAWIECRTHSVHPAGDHDIVIGEVVALEVADAEGDGRAGGVGALAPEPGPLLFLRGGYGRFEGL